MEYHSMPRNITSKNYLNKVSIGYKRIPGFFLITVINDFEFPIFLEVRTEDGTIVTKDKVSKVCPGEMTLGLTAPAFTQPFVICEYYDAEKFKVHREEKVFTVFDPALAVYK